MEIHEIPRGKVYEGEELIELLDALVPLTSMLIPSPPVEIVAGRNGGIAKTFSQLRIIAGIVMSYNSGRRKEVMFETSCPSGLLKFSTGNVGMELETEIVKSLKFL